MIRRIKRTISYILTAAMLLALGGCTTWDNFNKAFIHPETEPKETIRIAVLEPFTGADAKDAADEISGIELAHDVFPKVLGKNVELVYYDTKSDIEALKEAAEHICTEEENITLVLGCYGNAMTIAAGDIFKEHSMPAIAVTCTNPLVTRTNPFYSRVCYIDLYEADGAAQFAYEYLKTDNAAILSQAMNEYAKAKSEAFANKLSELSGREYLPVSAFTSAGTDLEPILNTFRLAGYKYVYLPESAETSKLVIAKAKDLALNFTWIGTSAWDGAGIDDVYYTMDYAPNASETTAGIQFRKAYTDKYGSGKTPSQQTALGYDAYLLALRGITEAGTEKNGALISAKINAVRDLQGATGTIIMNEIGDPIKSIIVNKVTNGKPSPVYSMHPAAAENDLAEPAQQEQTQQSEQ